MDGMRINVFLASCTGMSRRAADQAISKGMVKINGQEATLGMQTKPNDKVYFDGKQINLPDKIIVVMNKPRGFVCSKEGQGSKTVYELLPPRLRNLKTVGRLDKDSSGLILLTNDGKLANKLTHPNNKKEKVYEILLKRKLSDVDLIQINQTGVDIGDKSLSIFKVQPSTLNSSNNNLYKYIAVLQEGRNRQIRRTFASLGYRVAQLHRTHFANYSLGKLSLAKYKKV